MVTNDAISYTKVIISITCILRISKDSHINCLHQMQISGFAPVSAVLYCTKLLQLCLTLCDPMDHSLPGSSIHGIFQTRIPEWVAISSSTSFQHLSPIFRCHNQDKSLGGALSLPSAFETQKHRQPGQMLAVPCVCVCALARSVAIHSSLQTPWSPGRATPRWGGKGQAQHGPQARLVQTAPPHRTPVFVRSCRVFLVPQSFASHALSRT